MSSPFGRTYWAYDTKPSMISPEKMDNKRERNEITMREFTTKSVRDIQKSGIRVIFDLASTMDDVVSLCVGEPDIMTPEHIRCVAGETMLAGKTKYTSNSGMLELRQEIAKYVERRFGVSYDPENEVICTVGAAEGIDAAIRTMVEPGDEIIVVEPSFVCYKPSISFQHGIPVPVETKAENGFRLTPEELEAAITPKTKALVLPYPGNPTGAIMEKEDLEKLVPIIIKHDLMVISDEVYAELTFGGREHVTIASLPGMKERTLVVSGFSKSFSMTGWRLGYVLGPKDFMIQLLKVHANNTSCASTTSQYAGIEALRDPELCDYDLQKMRAVYEERRTYLLGELERIGLPCHEPQGAFYAFPSIKHTGLTSDEFCQRLLLEEHCAVVPGSAFGDCGEGFIRISYAYAREEIATAIAIIERFLQKIANEKK